MISLLIRIKGGRISLGPQLLEQGSRFFFLFWQCKRTFIFFSIEFGIKSLLIRAKGDWRLYQSYCPWHPAFKQWSRIFQNWIWYCWRESRMRKIYILQSVASIFHPLSHPCSPILSPQGNSHNESKLSRLQLLVLSSTFESLIHGTTRKKSFRLSWVRCHMLRSLATNHGRVTNSQVVPQILPKFAA